MLSEQDSEHICGHLSLDESFMNLEQAVLDQRLRLLATRRPDGFDGTTPFCRRRCKTRQMQERIRHEHQTPMFPNGFGAAHALDVQAQMSFAVLIS